jgi:hypothetical protein
MSNYRFSPRAMKFLEFYFGGAKMKDAVRAAGYSGSTDQSLCNTGRKILDKFGSYPQALFSRAGARELRIARLLADLADHSKSELQQLKALMILSKCTGG